MSVTMNRGVVTCIPKADKDRRVHKNWRPISPLNVLYKIISTCITNRIKKTLNYLIDENQTGFIPGRCISENIRLLYDTMFETKKQNKNGLLILIDLEKAFDTVSKEFIMLVLDKFGFGPNMQKWVNILISNSSSCIIQNGHLSSFFDYERGCRQGGPISPYLFLFVAEILGIMIRRNKYIKGITLNGTEHTIGQYADDNELFLDGSETISYSSLNKKKKGNRKTK